MKRLLFLVFVVIAAFAVGGVASGCTGPKTVTSMELAPKAVTLRAAGQTATLTAAFKDGSGAAVGAGMPATWSTSDAKVATVTAGVVTAVDSGTATITATAGALTASAKTTVEIPKALVITPTTLTVGVYEKKAFAAKLIDTAGREMTGKPLDWQSDNDAVASVVGGKVYANHQGVCTVTARWDAVSATASVVVGATASGSEAPAAGSRWNYRTRADEMGRGEIRQARVESSNELQLAAPNAGPQHAVLSLASEPKWGKYANLFVENGQFLCGASGCDIDVRFDEGKAQTYRAVEALDRDSRFLVINRDYPRFVGNLKKASRVRIEVEFYGDGARILDFDVHGLQWENPAAKAPAK